MDPYENLRLSLKRKENPVVYRATKIQRPGDGAVPAAGYGRQENWPGARSACDQPSGSRPSYPVPVNRYLRGSPSTSSIYPAASMNTAMQYGMAKHGMDYPNGETALPYHEVSRGRMCNDVRKMIHQTNNERQAYIESFPVPVGLKGSSSTSNLYSAAGMNTNSSGKTTLLYPDISRERIYNEVRKVINQINNEGIANIEIPDNDVPSVPLNLSVEILQRVLNDIDVKMRVFLDNI